MSYNGSGTFQINTSGQPVVAGTVISATAFNALTADLATGLSTAITKDGQTTTTARIPFAAGINSSLTTDSTSTGTGSIITGGGVGVAKALYVGTTLNVTGVATFSAAPIYSSLTASSAVATDASKALVSVTNTGTGNNVLATSPTLVTPILGAASATSVTVAAGAVGTPSITTTGNTNTGIFFPAADTIAFTEGGTEAMRIDSSGNVGIGTISPATFSAYTKLSVLNGIALAVDATNGGVVVGANTSGTELTYLSMGRNYNLANTGEIALATATSKALILGTNGIERMRIAAGAPILCLSGGNTSATGTGIAFPSTQSASSDANTLDDYEEGSWTPTYLGSITNPTITYNQQVGRYVKIGRLVYVEANIATTSASGGSGVLNLGGLPFTTDSACTETGISIGITAVWGTAPTQGGFQSSSVLIALFSGGNTNLSVSALSNSAVANYLRFQASYRASA